MLTPCPCCHLTCDKPAQWEIFHAPFSPEDNTLACTEHVGELLTDSPEHRIFPFDSQAAAERINERGHYPSLGVPDDNDKEVIRARVRANNDLNITVCPFCGCDDLLNGADLIHEDDGSITDILNCPQCHERLYTEV